MQNDRHQEPSDTVTEKASLLGGCDEAMKDFFFATETSTHAPACHGYDLSERLEHVLVVGGDEHSIEQVLWNFLIQDIEAGNGVAIIDPVGTLANRIVDYIPPHRTNNTVFFKPSDRDFPIGLNPLHGVPVDDRPSSVKTMMSVFESIWELDLKRTPLLVDLLRNSLRPLYDFPGATLMHLKPMLVDQAFRKRVLAYCTDPYVHEFWTQEFDGTWSSRDRVDKPASVLTRVRSFLADPTIRNIVSQKTPPLRFQDVIERNQIFIADLAEVDLGAETTLFFGALLGAQFRAAVLEQHQKGGMSDVGHSPFFIVGHACERLEPLTYSRLFQTTGNAGVGAMLSTTDLEQHDPVVAGRLAKAGSVIAFRLSPNDARVLEARFGSLAQAQETLSTLSGGRLCSSRFQYELISLEPLSGQKHGRKGVVSRSRSRLAKPRDVVEKELKEFAEKQKQRALEHSKRKIRPVSVREVQRVIFERRRERFGDEGN